MRRDVTDRWNELPEFLAVRTYVRCLDRLLQSVSEGVQWRMYRPMLMAAVAMGSGIACFHGAHRPLLPVSARERDAHRERALRGVHDSRDGLDEIARDPTADRAELLVARELLDRIEGSVRG
jgi:hypothetical protein